MSKPRQRQRRLPAATAQEWPSPDLTRRGGRSCAWIPQGLYQSRATSLVGTTQTLMRYQGPEQRSRRVPQLTTESNTYLNYPASQPLLPGKRSRRGAGPLVGCQLNALTRHHQAHVAEVVRGSSRGPGGGRDPTAPCASPMPALRVVRCWDKRGRMRLDFAGPLSAELQPLGTIELPSADCEIVPFVRSSTRSPAVATATMRR